MSKISVKRLAIIGTIVVIIIILALTLPSRFIFSFRSSSPKLSGDIPTSLAYSELTFTQNIKSDPNKLLLDTIDNERLINRLEVDKNKIKVYFNIVFKQDEKHTLIFKNIVSERDKTIQELRFDFRTVYIPSRDISQKDTNKQMDQTQDKSKSVTDPILAILPYRTPDFKIEAYSNFEIEQSNRGVGLLISLFPTVTNDPTPEQIRIMAEQYKQKALDYIRSKGFNPDDYVIVYKVL